MTAAKRCLFLSDELVQRTLQNCGNSGGGFSFHIYLPVFDFGKVALGHIELLRQFGNGYTERFTNLFDVIEHGVIRKSAP